MKPKSLETRFPTGRIKKVMQADDEVGKVAVASPVLISRALELFLQKLVDDTYQVTTARAAKTVTGSHLKACIEANPDFDFLKEVVAHVPDLGNEMKEDKGPGRPRKRKDDDLGGDEQPGPSGEDDSGKLTRRGKKDEPGVVRRQNSRKKTKECQVVPESVGVPSQFDLNSPPVDDVEVEVKADVEQTAGAADHNLQDRFLEEAIEKHRKKQNPSANHVDDVDDDYDDM